MSQPIPRRAFLRGSASLAAAVTTTAFSTVRGQTAPAAPATRGASERIVCGVVGLRRGLDLARAIAGIEGAELAYLCEADDNRLRDAMKALEPTAARPKAVKDFRDLLDDKHLDAIFIATPDHWHAPAAILACDAGKHVYVEKPCSHNPAEGEMLIAAARKHARKVQHGTQRRSWPGIVEGIGRVRSGEIGEVRYAKAWYANQRGPIKPAQATPVPSNLDWSLWQGPAPERSYQDNVHPYNWHWLWHWGTGEMGNNGVHAIDLCRWGLGVDYPLRVTAGGGRFAFDDEQETPDTQIGAFDFGVKFISVEIKSTQPRGFEGSNSGAAFYGTKGTLVCGDSTYKMFDLKNEAVGANEQSGRGDAGHVDNFLRAIRGDAALAAEIEEGHKSTLLCHLANIAWRTGSTVNLDPQTHRIIGNKDADTLWSREYRKGWEPKV